MTSIVQPGQAVDLCKTHKVGHVRIGEHPGAVTQHNAAHTPPGQEDSDMMGPGGMRGRGMMGHGGTIGRGMMGQEGMMGRGMIAPPDSDAAYFAKLLRGPIPPGGRYGHGDVPLTYLTNAASTAGVLGHRREVQPH